MENDLENLDADICRSFQELTSLRDVTWESKTNPNGEERPSSMAWREFDPKMPMQQVAGALLRTGLVNALHAVSLKIVFCAYIALSLSGTR